MIKKIDSETKKPLQGAVFKITRGDGSVVRESAVTDAYGLIHLPELETCTLVIAEAAAPDGYAIDETPKTIEVRAGQTYEVTFTNTRRSSLTIRKIDEDTRQPLKNAVFSISKANGELVKDRAETDENGVITLDGAHGLHTGRDRSRSAGWVHFAGHAQDHRGQGGRQL